MKRLFAFVAAAALCFPIFGAKAWWHSIQQVGVGGTVTYTGPGDVISFSTGAYYGLMAYSSATRGNRLVSVCDSTGGVDNGSCKDVLSSATTGLLVTATNVGTNNLTCPGNANCKIRIYYDLTGGNQCTAASCDAIQATVASRDTLSSSCGGTVTVCGVSNGGGYFSANNFTFSAPAFLSVGADVLTNTGNNISLITTSSANQGLGFFGTGLAPYISGDGLATHLQTTLGYGAYHGISGLVNGASSYLALDSATPVTGTLGISGGAAALAVHTDGFGDFLPAGGLFLEGGVALAGPSSATAQSLNANVKSRWGF